MTKNEYTDHNAPTRGTFIVLEGGDGSGKSTQSKNLTASLRNQGYDVVETREPGGTNFGEKIRKILLQTQQDRTDSSLSSMTEALLFAAARAEHVDKVIKPALNEGKIVISDRFVDSSIAYQGAGSRLGTDNMSVLAQLAIGDLVPDLTIVLDIDPDKANKRKSDRGHRSDRFEAESAQFQEAVRLSFLELARENPEIYTIIDATLDPDTIGHTIEKHIQDVLPPINSTDSGTKTL